jgi:hypothetical protein
MLHISYKLHPVDRRAQLASLQKYLNCIINLRLLFLNSGLCKIGGQLV